MDLLSSLHTSLGWAVMIVGGLAGAWATAAHWYEPLRIAPMWWAHHVFHALVAIQVTFGAVLVGVGGREADGNHIFYGFLTFVGVGLIIGYRHLSEYRYLLYGLGGLFVMGLAIRAFTLPAIPT